MTFTDKHELPIDLTVFGSGHRSAPSWVDLRRPRVSVVVPARNEARNLPHVLAGIPADVHEVILVDGHSTDDTIAVARSCWPGVRVVTQTRRGKGNALACGFAEVTGDIVVMLDADGSADPGEIPAFVRALTDGADFAKGTRFAQGGSSTDITRFRRIGNACLNGLVNLLFGTRYTDLCYGYNAFWVRLMPTLDLPAVFQPGLTPADLLWGDGFEIETLINVRVASAGSRIAEVGSAEVERIHGVSNLNAVSDGLRVLRTILHERHLHAKRRRRGLPGSAKRSAHHSAHHSANHLPNRAVAVTVDDVSTAPVPRHAIPTPSGGMIIDLREATDRRSASDARDGADRGDGFDRRLGAPSYVLGDPRDVRGVAGS